MPVAYKDFVTWMEKDGTILMRSVQAPQKLFTLKNNSLRTFSWAGVPKTIQRQIRDVSPTKNKGEYLFTTNDSLWLYQNQQTRFIKKGNFNFFESRLVYGEAFVKEQLADNNYNTWIWDGKTLRLFLKATLQPGSKTNQYKLEIASVLPYDYVFNLNGSTYLLEKQSRNYSVIYNDNPSNDVSYQDSPGKPDAIRYIATEKGLLGLVKNGFRNFSEQAVPYTWSVVEDKKGDYWFMNHEKSLQKYDGRHITEVIDYPKALNTNEWYYHALKDKTGNLWLPNAKGILHFDGQKYTHLLTNTKVPLAFTLAENKAQNTVAATTLNGVFMIDTRPPFKHRLHTDTTRMFRNLVMCAAVAPDGAYWFSGYGVARYDSLSGKSVYYNNANKKLAAGGIMSLFFDRQGTLWAGSWDKGLFRFNAKKDVFESVFGGWLKGVVPFVEQLDANHLLIGSSFSLHSVSLKDTTQVRCFNHHNGFMGEELGQLGSFRDSKGKIWLTSGSVLSVLDPAQLDVTQLSTICANITQVSLGDSLPARVPFRGNRPAVELLYGQRSVSFTVEALGEDKPFEAQYSYRVLGFLNKWSPWQTQDIISLTNLPGGRFTLEVKTRRGITSGESETTKLDFIVSIPFWQSPNFYKYASILGLFLLSVAIYFWLRQRRNNRQIIAQNTQIKTKEQEVRLLQVQTIQAQMNPHFTFNVLGSIQSLIESKDIEKAGENIVKLSALIRNFLEASMPGNDEGSSVFNKEIPLIKEIELLQMYLEFEQLQYKDRVNFELNVDDSLVPDNYRIPPSLLQPFVENAVKHGLLYKEAGGKIWINFIKIDEDTLKCVVEDNGVGRTRAAEIQKGAFKSYKSRGTQLVKQRVEALNEIGGYEIDIKTDDRPGGGTVVTVIIGYKQ